MEGLLSYDTFGFAVELGLAAAIVARGEPRRERTAPWLVAAVALIAGCAVLGKLLLGQGWLNLLRYALVFGSVLAGLRLCSTMSWQAALFYALAAYNVQHAAWRVVGLIVTATHTDLVIVLMTTIGMPLIAGIGLVFSRAVRENRDATVNNRQLIQLVSVVIAADLVLSYIPVAPTGKLGSTSPVEGAYAVICCTLTLAIQSGMLTRSRLEREQALLQQLWEMNREQYEFTRQSIDVINARSHDLKKQVRVLLAAAREGSGTGADEAIQEIRRAIDAYENKAKTGNAALDVLLTQKLMQADAQGASVSYLVDGAEFGFLDEVDLYALFGNVLDNALEAVAGIEDEARRIVNLRAVRRAQMLVVHCENYVGAAETARATRVAADGLPMTTKDDADGHGFGLRSIRMVVEKYGGNLAVRTEGDVFHLQVVIPQRQAA